MDQDSFRQLIQSGPSSATAVRNASAPQAKLSKKKASTADASKPAFKPRTVKKDDDKYRNRAAERRQGKAHDFAQVEALAADFEERNKELDKETVEQQRQYLGGDSEHTVLVKGLDFALLEQNKARLAEAAVDDDTLEQAFIEGSSTVPKKRTREDIVKELKSKRQKGEIDVTSVPAEDAAIDEAKKAGKFKPIGFKPIGPVEGKKAKKKVKVGEKDGVKKKKKAIASKHEAKPDPETPTSVAPTIEPAQSTLPAPSVPTPMDDDDDDIFAGAGEYTGIELGDDEDEDDDSARPLKPDANGTTSDGEIPEPQPTRGRWVDIDEPAPAPKPASPSRVTPQSPSAQPPRSPSPSEARAPEEGEELEEAPVRLQPLASSSVPSIRELLAIDEAEEKAEKRRARKEKKKEKGALSAEGKVDRDYQRLKAYQEKKGNAK